MPGATARTGTPPAAGLWCWLEPDLTTDAISVVLTVCCPTTTAGIAAVADEGTLLDMLLACCVSSAPNINVTKQTQEFCQIPLWENIYYYTHTHLTALFPGLPGWAGTRKVKPIWILLKQETVSGSGFSWARQITMPAPHHSVFYRPDVLPAAQPTASKHWRHINK